MTPAQIRKRSMLNEIAATYRNYGISFHKGKPDRPLSEMAEPLGIRIHPLPVHAEPFIDHEYTPAGNRRCAIFHVPQGRDENRFFCTLLHHYVRIWKNPAKQTWQTITSHSLTQTDREAAYAMLYPPEELCSDIQAYMDTDDCIDVKQAAAALDLPYDTLHTMLRIYGVIDWKGHTSNERRNYERQRSTN